MRILQLTSYPTLKPLHGGQIRCHHIAAQLREAGHEVHSMAIYANVYGDADSGDIPFNSSSEFWDPDFPNLSDYFSGLFAAEDPKTFKALQSKIDAINPHIVIVEQPWLFKAARRATADNIKLVYSSQNIEWRLKEKVLQRRKGRAKELIDDIKQLEIYATRNSHLTIACTEADAAYYQSLAGMADPIVTVVAGNGVEPFSCEGERINYWLGFYHKPFPIFVSSAHPPNAEGFWHMTAPGLTFLEPDQQIVVIGGVSNIITQMAGFHAYSSTNLSRLNIAGTKSKTELQAIMKASQVVLLPITVGEGSNLKTAEALESGRPVIGTTKAFRGFEDAMDLPHVTIADVPDDFRRAVQQALRAPRYLDGTPDHIRERYYWSNQLKFAVNAILEICK